MQRGANIADSVCVYSPVACQFAGALLLSGCAAAPDMAFTPVPGDTMPAAIVQQHMDWVSARLSRRVDTLPVVIFDSAAVDFLGRLHDPDRPAVGAYAFGVVWLRPELCRPVAASVCIGTLVHELTHDLLARTGDPADCASEWVAYAMEDHWRREHGYQPRVDQGFVDQLATRCLSRMQMEGSDDD